MDGETQALELNSEQLWLKEMEASVHEGKQHVIRYEANIILQHQCTNHYEQASTENLKSVDPFRR